MSIDYHEQDAENTILILDQTISSKSLKSKISDLSFQQKIEAIVFKLIDDDKEGECYFDFDRNKRFIMNLKLKYGFDLNRQQLPRERFDRTDWLELIMYSSVYVNETPPKFRNDREFIMQVLTYGKPDCSCILHFVKYKDRPDCAISEDREYALQLVKVNGYALSFLRNASNDRELVMEAVKNNGDALHCAKEEFKNDREIVLCAVMQDGLALKHASRNLRQDREIVLCAVRQNGYALRYADEKNKSDTEVVLEAVLQDAKALLYVCETLRNDYSFVMRALNSSQNLEYFDLDCVGESLRDRKDIVLKVVKAYGMNLQTTSTRFKNDKEVVLEAVKQEGEALEYASTLLKHDREFVLDLVKLPKPSKSLQFVPNELRSDKEIAKQAIKSEANRMKQLDLLKVLSKFQRKKLIIFQQWFLVDWEIFTYYKEEYRFVAPPDHHFWISIMKGIEIHDTKK